MTQPLFLTPLMTRTQSLTRTYTIVHSGNFTATSPKHKQSGCAAVRYVDALARMQRFSRGRHRCTLTTLSRWFRWRTVESASAIYYHISVHYFRGEQPRDVQRWLRVDG